MFCSNCGTQYDIVPVENGKSKFCRNCGNLLYKNENGTNIFSQLVVIPSNDEISKQQEIEAEKLRQVEILKQKQKEADLEQQRLLEIQRQKDIALEKQRQLELQQKEAAEKDRLRQLEILKQQQEEFEKQKAAALEKQKQEEILKNQAAILAEKNRKEKEIELQKQKEIEEREAKKRDELNKQKEAEIEKKQQEQINIEISKSNNALNAESESDNVSASIKTEEKKSKKALYFIVPILLIAFICSIAFFAFPEKIKSLFNSSPIATTDTSSVASTKTIDTKDTALIEQIKADLIGKEVLSWNAIKPNEIKELTILSVTEIDKNSNYVATVQLDDNSGTKAITELKLSYNKIILANVTTNKITYKNTAPTNAWFSFEPILNCSILVNTNNNPIQLKTCENCPIQKINTTAENALKLATQPTTIFISSDTKYEAEIDFTYIPL